MYEIPENSLMDLFDTEMSILMILKAKKKK